tara:strand:+ start:676 stop:882 length:207 start_codon:yes stop_codon:yes gene_type:complete
MEDTWYNWYYYTQLEIQEAKEHIQVLEARKEKIIEDKEKRQISGKEKQTKIRGIQLSIDALKYKYTIE